ncbi:MAG: hypothetical protein OHK0015_27070 [Chloroflexi bacterium OHK40]
MRAVAVAYGLAAVILLAMFPLAGIAAPTSEPEPLLHEDALIPPPPGPGILAGASDGRGPSQFLAGSVAVRLVLPESDGSIDHSSEDWSPAQIEAVRQEVQAGLDWWSARLPLAHLRFELRVEVVPIPYEPINYGLSQEGRWIGAALTRLGYSGASYFDQAYAAAEALRAERGTDWATTIFVANSANHPTGTFIDGRFAYAYLNGPFVVMTSDSGAYGQHNLDLVTAHELGHTFGALDQYASARISCDRRSGYLDTPTTNSQYGGCGTRNPSIMLEPIAAFAAGQVDTAALHQLGYRDSDGDSLIDPLDTAPTIEIRESTLASATGRPVLQGSAQDSAFPSPYHQDVSINHIRAVEFRVDGGLWLPADAVDGNFDERAEQFSAELPLYDGRYTVELRAINSAGVASTPVTRELNVTWIGPQPAYRVSAPEAVAQPQVALQLDAPAATQGVQVSEEASFAGAEWQPLSPTLNVALEGADGPRTIYVRFRDQFGLISLPYVVETTLDTRPPRGRVMRDPHDAARLLLEARDEGSAVTAVQIEPQGLPPLQFPFTPAVELADLPAGPLTVRFRDAAGNLSPAYVPANGYEVAMPMLTR